jgi:hypothetical protein
MMNNIAEAIKLSKHVKSNVHVLLKDENGNIKDERKIHNLVVNTGLAHIADQLSSSPGQTAMSHMAIGTGTTAADAADTTLETELDRNALTSNTDSGAVVTYVGDWAAGDGTGAITEAGILNNSSGGTLLARSVFSVVNKGASDTLQITWTLTFSV